MFTREQWVRDLLAALGNSSPSSTVLNFVVGWSVAETNANSGALYNLLNTELDEPGATPFNEAGVKNYTSYEEGINATVATLENGYYPDIVQALQWNNDNALLGPNNLILKELNTWCGSCNYGHGFIALGAAHSNDPFDYGSGPSTPVTPAPSGPNDHQLKAASDTWNSFYVRTLAETPPPMGTGIYGSWLVNLLGGRQFGPPQTYEYHSVDWSGNDIIVQEFARARCEWFEGKPNWYGVNGKLN